MLCVVASHWDHRKHVFFKLILNMNRLHSRRVLMIICLGKALKLHAILTEYGERLYHFMYTYMIGRTVTFFMGFTSFLINLGRIFSGALPQTEESLFHEQRVHIL